MDGLHAECTVSKALATVLWIGEIAGFAPLKFRKVGGEWYVCVSTKADIYSKVIGAIFCITTLTVSILDAANNYVALLTWIIKIVLTICIACTGKTRMRDLISSLNEVQKIKSELSDYRECGTYEKEKWLLLACALVSSSIVIINYGIYWKNIIEEDGNVLMAALHFFNEGMIITQLTFELQFAFLALEVVLVFKHLNKCLQYFIDEIPLEDSGIDQEKNRLPKLNHSIRRFSILYVSSCCIVRTIDKVYSLPLLLTTASAMLHLLFVMYNMVISCLSVDSAKELAYLMTILAAWFLKDLMTLLLLVEPAHRTQEEVDGTKALVNKLSQNPRLNKDDGAFELDLFFQQLVLNETTYSPMKMFTLDRALIVAIFSTIITYLVVIVQ